MIRLSLKNIIRKRARAFLIFLCSAIASCVIFIQTAQTNSVQNSLKTLVGEAISGQYIVYNSEESINVLESQFADLELFQWDVAQQNLLKAKTPFIKSIAPRLRFGGMLSLEEENIGLNFQALTKEHFNRLNEILEFKDGGVPREDMDFMISEPIAKVLACEVGDTLVILANNRDGYLSDGLLKVSGIFKTSGISQFLIPIGYLPYDKGQEILGLEEEEVMELVVNLAQLDDSSAKLNSFKGALAPLNQSLKVASWSESAPLLNSIVLIWKNAGYATKLIFLIFSFLILLNIVIMITNHRKKEIGTLLAFGFKPLWVVNSIAMEYLLLISSGVLFIGIILKILAQTIFHKGIYIPWEELQAAYLSTKIIPEIHWFDIISVCLFFGLVSYLAVFISLRKLPKTEITTLLRTGT